MNPEQKAARAYLKRKMSMGMGGTGSTAGLWQVPPKPSQLPSKMRLRREIKTIKPPTFEDDMRARERAIQSELLARSRWKTRGEADG